MIMKYIVEQNLVRSQQLIFRHNITNVAYEEIFIYNCTVNNLLVNNK